MASEGKKCKRASAKRKERYFVVDSVHFILEKKIKIKALPGNIPLLF